MAAGFGIVGLVLVTALPVAARPLHCPLPAEGYSLGDKMPRVSALLTAGKPVSVVTLGSSSTEGVGASSRLASYPAQMGRALAHVFPSSDFAVFNRGIGGQSAAEMLARANRDVVDLHPDLVVWQTGTIEAIDSYPVDRFAETVARGVAAFRAQGIEVMLVNQQYSPRLEAKHPHYRDYVDALRRVAGEANVAMLDRYASMQRWGTESAGGPMALMSADSLHMKDDSYRCFGAAAAAVLACAAGVECPVK